MDDAVFTDKELLEIQASARRSLEIQTKRAMDTAIARWKLQIETILIEMRQFTNDDYLACGCSDVDTLNDSLVDAISELNRWC